MTPGSASEKKKILVLLSDTGGGHRASAGAVTEGLVEVFGDGAFEFVVLDIWTEYGNWPFNSFVSVYRFASENPWCWRWMYESSKSPISRSLFLASGYAVSGVNIKKVVVEVNPDIIISVHPLCQHIILQILKELSEEAAAGGASWQNPPFVTVVTDLGGAHPTWFHPKATRVYVPSFNILQNARMEGVSEAKIKHYGLPLRKAFWTRIIDLPEATAAGGDNDHFREKVQNAQFAMRRKLGLKEYYPTVLVVGGGEGVGSIDQVAEGIVTWCLKTSAEAYETFKIQEGAILGELQIIIVCGKNESSRQKVLKVLQTFVKKSPQNVSIDNRSSTYKGPGAVGSQAAAQANAAGANTAPMNSAVKLPLIVSAKYTETPPHHAIKPSGGASSPPKERLQEAAEASSIPVEELMKHVQSVRDESLKNEQKRMDELEQEMTGSIRAVNPFEMSPLPSPRQDAPVPKLDTAAAASGGKLRRNSNEVHVNAVVYSFVSNIDELMTASDLIVTKAGPGTIAEATTRALPVLLSSYMPGQEEGNVSFVLNNKFGTYSENPNEIGLIVRQWLLNPRFETKLNNMRYRSLKAASPTASLDIARDIGRLIDR